MRDATSTEVAGPAVVARFDGRGSRCGRASGANRVGFDVREWRSPTGRLVSIVLGSSQRDRLLGFRARDAALGGDCRTGDARGGLFGQLRSPRGTDVPRAGLAGSHRALVDDSRFSHASWR